MPKQRAVFVFALCAILLGLASHAICECKGSAKVTSTREERLRVLLSGPAPESTFRVLSETADSGEKLKLVLYSVDGSAETNARMVYIAGLADNSNVLFTYDVTRYIPPVTPQPNTLPTIDGCLNTFTLPDEIQGIHVNLFSGLPRAGVSGAADVFLAVPRNGQIEPVLKLNETSLLRSRTTRQQMHQDSTIWLRKVNGAITEVVWQQFSEVPAGIMTAKYSQSVLYRWEENGFQKMGTLEPKQIPEHLKDASPIVRCDAIIPLRFDVEEPRPNQPAP